MKAVTEQAVVCPVRCGGADRNHRNIIHKEHDHRKDRQAEPAVRDNAVDPVRDRTLARILPDIGGADHLCNIVVSLIDDDRFCLIIHFLLRRLNILFNMCKLFLGEAKLFDRLFVAFKQLDREPALLLLGHIMHGSFFNMRDRVLDGTGKRMRQHGLARFCRLDRRIRRFQNIVTLQRGDLDDPAAERLGKLRDMDLVAALPDDVHHVDRDNDRNAELDQLRRQIKIAFQIRAVHEIEDRVRPLADQIIPRDDLLQRIRRKRVNARQIGHGHAVPLL